MAGIQRTMSDISFELTPVNQEKDTPPPLPPISEIEDAKCECCGMSEECTPDYIRCVRSKFSGKLICGLCAEAVKAEMEKNQGTSEEDAVHTHMSACIRFNRIGRTHPVLYQAEAVREILKKSSRVRAQSVSPNQRKGSIARSSSCMPAISKEIGDKTMVN